MPQLQLSTYSLTYHCILSADEARTTTDNPICWLGSIRLQMDVWYNIYLSVGRKSQPSLTADRKGQHGNNKTKWQNAPSAPLSLRVKHWHIVCASQLLKRGHKTFSHLNVLTGTHQHKVWVIITIIKLKITTTVKQISNDTPVDFFKIYCCGWLVRYPLYPFLHLL